MDPQTTTQTYQHLFNDVLVWIGFGFSVGIIAKAIMPGRDPGGAMATVGTGIAGTIVGCGTFSFFVAGQRITPISPTGALVSIAGAFFLLFLYRMLAGYFFTEGETNLQVHQLFRAKRARRSTYRRVA